MLAGDGALIFAREIGFPECSPDSLIVESERRRWESKHGTVGCVAFDGSGKLAVATSTGGIFNKLAGRVGDSPLIGCGTYADDYGAVSCTGHGEAIIRVVMAKTAVDLLKSGMDPQTAAKQAIELLAAKTESTGRCDPYRSARQDRLRAQHDPHADLRDHRRGDNVGKLEFFCKDNAMVIDFEHHYIPAELGRRMGMDPTKEAVRTRDASVHSQLFDLEAQIRDMDRVGIDVAVQSCILGWDTTLENCRLINDCTAQMQRDYPGRFVGLAHAPVMEEAGLAELERAVGDLGIERRNHFIASECTIARC